MKNYNFFCKFNKNCYICDSKDNRSNNPVSEGDHKNINNMKHFSTMLLALGLAAFSAAGQNVTVIMKDGTSHKFNADYLSELSFKDVQQGPETVEFKSILV